MCLPSMRRLFLMSFDLLLMYHLHDHHLEATMVINRHRQHRAGHHRALRHRVELVLEKMMTMIDLPNDTARKQMLIEHQSTTGLHLFRCLVGRSDLGLAQYLETFKSNGFEEHDIEMVSSLTQEDLTHLSITMLAHRKKILAEAAKLT